MKLASPSPQPATCTAHMSLSCWIYGSGSAWELWWVAAEGEQCEGDEGLWAAFSTIPSMTSPPPETELGLPVVVRAMRTEEFNQMRELSVSAFNGDPVIGPLLDALRSSWAWDDELSFVADLDGDLVGHVLYTRALLDAAPRLVEVLVLSPIGVRPDLQNRGIGGRLIRESLAVVGRRPEPLVFLEGHPRYYPRFGFERATDLGFTAPSVRIPQDAFMVHRLPGYESWMTGTLVYPDAFWRLDAVGLRDNPPDQVTG